MAPGGGPKSRQKVVAESRISSWRRLSATFYDFLPELLSQLFCTKKSQKVVWRSKANFLRLSVTTFYDLTTMLYRRVQLGPKGYRHVQTSTDMYRHVQTCTDVYRRVQVVYTVQLYSCTVLYKFSQHNITPLFHTY